MARGLNKIILQGNLGRDPDMRYTPAGVPVANAALAVNGWENGAESVEWFRLVFWDKLAEVIGQYGAKGKPILIEGRGRSRKYTDNQNIERTQFEVVVSNLILLSAGERQADPEGHARPTRPATVAKASEGEGDGWGDFDEVPF